MKDIVGMRKLVLVSLFLILGASNPVAVKAALLQGWQPLSLGLLRMGFIGLFFLGWVSLIREHPIGPNAHARRWALIAASCKGLAVLCFYLALAVIPVNRAVILSTISPMVNLALVHLVLEQERVRQHHLLGIGITFLGLLSVLLLRRGLTSFPADYQAPVLMGDLAMIASVVLHQAMIVCEKKALLGGSNPRQLVISTNMVSVSIFALLILFSGHGLRPLPTGGGALLTYLYLISFVGVILFYYRRWLVSIMEVSYLNSFSHAGKALSILFAVLLLRETLPAASLAGFALIVLGTIVGAGKLRTSTPDKVQA